MTDENRVYVGDDAYGAALYVGDEVQVIDHPLINPAAVGEVTRVHSTVLTHDIPMAFKVVVGGEGWFETQNEDGSLHGLHCSVVQKKESA